MINENYMELFEIQNPYVVWNLKIELFYHD